MKILTQCGIIFGICVAGEVLHVVTRLPVPGNVFGMIILFLLLYFKVIKKQQIRRVSRFLIGNMAFFFIPSGVAIIAYFDDIRHVLVPYLLIILLTTIIVLAVTGRFAQWMQRALVNMGFRQRVTAARTAHAAGAAKVLQPAGARGADLSAVPVSVKAAQAPAAGQPIAPRRPPVLPPREEAAAAGSEGPKGGASL